MAVVFIDERKKQKKLIWILLLIVGVTIFLLALRFSKEENLPISILNEESSGNPAITSKNIEINFGILENSLLGELQPFEEIEPFDEEVGRENPFLPY